MKVVIVGFGTGGLFAASFLKKYNREIEVLVIDKKKIQVEHPCAFPFGIEKDLDLNLLAEDFLLNGVICKEYSEVIKVKDKEKKIVIRSLEKDNYEEEISYDKLVISSGSRPIIIDNDVVERNYNKGVFAIGSLDDAININNYIKNKNPKKAVVGGGGANGLEMAKKKKKRGIEVSIIESEEIILPHYFDKDMSLTLKANLEDNGINLFLNHRYEDIEELSNSNYRIIAKDKITGKQKSIESNLVLFSISKRPNVEFLKNSNIKYGNEGIFVNENFETSVKDVYAIGDVALSASLIENKNIPMRLAVPAYKGGVIVAKRIAGLDKFYEKYGRTIKHKGNYFTFASKTFGLEYSSTGVSSNLAKRLGYTIEEGKVTGFIKPGVIIDNLVILDKGDNSSGKKRARKISFKCTVKIVVDTRTGKILGAQAVGKKASEKINFISLALREGQNIFDFVENELSYSPLISDTYDVTMQAGDLIIRKLYKKFERDSKNKQ